MADKQKDSKIMSMLERKGILRKVGDDSSEAPSQNSNGEAAAGYDTDIKPLFDQPATTPIKTAPRQPVPGMTTPIFPQTKPSDASQSQAKTEDIFAQKTASAAGEAPKPSATVLPPSVMSKMPTPPSAPPASAPAPTSAPAPAPTTPAPTSAPTPEPQAAPPKQTSAFGGLDLFRKSGNATETQPAESASKESEPRPENYTDRYLNITELYDALALRSKKTDTIYLIEEYLQTLPGSLPDSQRRDIVAKLLASSGFDYDLLMGDGVLRVKMLKEYAERFARHTDDYIAARQTELEELDQQMARTRRLIENRKELHKKQFYTIEAEAQRLKEILTFISG